MLFSYLSTSYILRIKRQPTPAGKGKSKMTDAGYNDSVLLVNFRNCLIAVNTMSDRSDFVAYFLSLGSSSYEVEIINKRLTSIFKASAFIESCFDLVRDIESTCTNAISEITEIMNDLRDLFSRRDMTRTGNDIRNLLGKIELGLKDMQDLKTPLSGN